MQIEIAKLERACLRLAEAIEEGRTDGIFGEICELLGYKVKKKGR